MLVILLWLDLNSVVFAVPRLAVPPEGIAFGEVFVGSNAVGRIELCNGGSATVSVSRVKACCGAKAEMSAMKIPPNGCECCQSPMFPISNWPLANGIGYWQQWQHSSGPLPAILRDLLLLVPSIWLAVRSRGGKMCYNICQ